MISTLILTLCFQVPQSGDVVRLESGAEVQGEILKETDDYIEMRVDSGMVLGFEKKRAAAILRAGERRPATPVAEGEVVESLARDQWFVLHDATGHVVGRLHETVTETDEGLRIGEEWHFANGADRVEVTVLETVDRAGEPTTCFYHERVRDERESVVDERVVRGVVRDGHLEVKRRTMTGSSTRRYDFPTNARFPLELRREMRHQMSPRIGEFATYDPRSEQWRRQAIEAGLARMIEHGGRKERVRVLRWYDDAETHTEWLDGASAPIRREVNGLSLVAVPAPKSEAMGPQRHGEPTHPVSLVVEADERFAFWLPNPLWANTSTRSGEVSAACGLHDATMSLVLLDQLDRGLLLDSALDTVERWLRLAHNDIDFRPRQHAVLRDHAIVRTRGEYEVLARGGSTRRICEVVVLERADGTFLSFCADAPRRAWAEVEPDVERALSRLELHRAGFAPELQGPIGKR